METCEPQNWCFFHQFCEVYQYPFVKCRLEPVNACIIFGVKFLPPILRRNSNQFNALHDNKTTESLIEWNIQPTEVHFKYQNSPTKTSPMVSAIMGKLNHRVIYIGDVQFHPSQYPSKYNSESVSYPDTTPTK